MNDDPGTPRAVTNARAVALTLVVALCCVLVAWHSARYSPQTALLASFVLVAPWAALLPGLWRGRRLVYAGAMLLTLPYIGYGLMDALANPGARAYASATALLGFAIFFALVAWLRISRLARPAPNARTAP